MKVSELVPGSIYTPDRKTVTKDYEHIIVGISLAPLTRVRERCIWRGFRERPIADTEQEIYMYLGFTMDEWSVNDIYKHHWFLVGGDRIMVNNYCIKLLKEIEYGTKT